MPSKKMKRIAMMLCLILSCALVALPVLAAKVLTENELGEHGGYDYELWMDKGGGDASMTLKKKGAFACEWTNAQNVLFRKGKKYDETQTHDQLGEISLNYGCDYQPDGNSYLCVYGWSVEPLVEFYVVESWGDWRPPGSSSKGTIEVDGGTYDVYETLRENQPSIKGTQTFPQYWSVRTDRNTEGTVSISEHIRAWEEQGMTLGKMYEVALCVEGYQSSGIANVHTNELVVGPAVEDASEGGAAEPIADSPSSEIASVESDLESTSPEEPIAEGDGASSSETDVDETDEASGGEDGTEVQESEDVAEVTGDETDYLVEEEEEDSSLSTILIILVVICALVIIGVIVFMLRRNRKNRE